MCLNYRALEIAYFNFILLSKVPDLELDFFSKLREFLFQMVLESHPLHTATIKLATLPHRSQKIKIPQKFVFKATTVPKFPLLF